VKCELAENYGGYLYNTKESQEFARGMCQGELLRERWLQVSAVGLCHTGAHPEFLIGGGLGADPEAIYNLCLILSVVLITSCCKHNSNVTLFAAAFVFVQI
jgi:hypothetical protein